jgi:hypothetical protein
MKRLQLLVTVLALLAATAGTLLMTTTAHAANAPAAPPAAGAATVRLGVYDSRAVALAWGRSPEFHGLIQKLRDEFALAKAAGDTARMRELDRDGMWAQVRLHQRVYSTAGAGDLLAAVRDQLPALAKEAGVVAIVSKWEVPYSDAAVELVDVTKAVANLFAPDVMATKYIEQMAQEPPVPLDRIRLDGKD